MKDNENGNFNEILYPPSRKEFIPSDYEGGYPCLTFDGDLITINQTFTNPYAKTTANTWVHQHYRDSLSFILSHNSSILASAGEWASF